MMMMGTRATTKATILRGWRLALTRSLRAHREPMSIRRVWELPRGRRVDLTTVSRGRCRSAALAPIPLLRPLRAAPLHSRRFLLCLERAIGLKP